MKQLKQVNADHKNTNTKTIPVKQVQTGAVWLLIVDLNSPWNTRILIFRVFCEEFQMVGVQKLKAELPNSVKTWGTHRGRQSLI